MSIFRKLKHVFSSEKPRKTLVIHVEKMKDMGMRHLIVAESVYPNLKLLLKHLADMHQVDLEIIEE